MPKHTAYRNKAFNANKASNAASARNSADSVKNEITTTPNYLNEEESVSSEQFLSTISALKCIKVNEKFKDFNLSLSAYAKTKIESLFSFNNVTVEPDTQCYMVGENVHISKYGKIKITLNKELVIILKLQCDVKHPYLCERCQSDITNVATPDNNSMAAFFGRAEMYINNGVSNKSFCINRLVAEKNIKSADKGDFDRVLMESILELIKTSNSNVKANVKVSSNMK